MTTRARWLILLITTPLVVLITVGGLLGATPKLDQQGFFPQLRVFNDVLQLVLGAYVEDVDVDRVMDGAMRGLADSLDSSSAFLTPAEVRALEGDAALPAGDIGVIVTRQLYLRIVGIRDGSPAADAGLRSGDYIRAIDDMPTRDMSALAGSWRLRGEPGSTVDLLIIRSNPADPQEMTLTRRAPASGPPVTTSQVAGGLTRVRVLRFDGETTDALRRVFADLSSENSPGAIIDLRGIADGPPELGIDAARLFIGDGVIATLAAREGEAETFAAEAGDGSVTLPIVLLVSNGTAHAAEVFAAALADHDRAELVGEATAGLAGRQRLVLLPERYGLWMTDARYVRSDTEATPIHGQGLMPDVGVARPFVDFGETLPPGDPALDKAIERLSGASTPPAPDAGLPEPLLY